METYENKEKSIKASSTKENTKSFQDPGQRWEEIVAGHLAEVFTPHNNAEVQEVLIEESVSRLPSIKSCHNTQRK